MAAAVLLGISSPQIPEKLFPTFVEAETPRKESTDGGPQPIPITFTHLSKLDYQLVTSIAVVELFLKLSIGNPDRVKTILNKWHIRYAK